MHTRLSRGHGRARVAALMASLALVIAVPASSIADDRFPNPAFEYVTLTPAAAGGKVIALINSGDRFDGVTFEGIPDGLGAVPVGNGNRFVDLYVAFEQSHVPFQGFADFEDSSVQRARLDLRTMQLTKLDEVLRPTAGFIRFCSAFMAGPEEGFSDYSFFVNEESNDIVTVPRRAPYGADPAIRPFRQAGYSVVLNTKTGAFDEIRFLGRHNHENTVIVPGGWRQTVSLSGDDTFTAPSSQIYLSTSSSPSALVNGRGTLWAFRVTGTDAGPVDPAEPQNNANDYLEIEPGDQWTGKFIRVPGDVARGRTAEPPQTALENWSNANNVFQFVRVEDMAYDPDNPRVVYFTDTGSTRLREDPATGRLFRPAADDVPYFNTDGRLFKMVFNEDNPRVVDELSIVAQGLLTEQLTNPAPPATPTLTVIDPGVGFRAPDNIDVGANSLMLQEDASSAKIWRWDLASTWTHVGTVTHPTAPTAGESSGIIDMSTWLGPGWWALDVQSHVNKTLGPAGQTYVTPLGGPVLTYQTRREDGQLLLMHVPGS
jgi:hypothetical protein